MAETSRDANKSHPRIPATQSLLKVDSPSLIVETLKQAESGEGLILRTFDSHGNHAKSSFSFNVDLTGVAETDLLEENPDTVEPKEQRIFTTCYTPLEIKTHRLDF